MEHFPSSFQAQKIQHGVVANRIKKIEQDLKCLRKKIVKSFHGSVHYHSEVSHKMLPDLSEEEQKNFYCMVKDELQQRGFVVRGKISGNNLSLIMFSNAPRNNEMDKVLKSYSDSSDPTTLRRKTDSVPSPSSDHGDPSDTDSRSSTPEGKKVSSVPNSPNVHRKSSIPVRKGTTVHNTKKTRSSSIPTMMKKGDTLPLHFVRAQLNREDSPGDKLATEQRSLSAAPSPLQAQLIPQPIPPQSPLPLPPQPTPSAETEPAVLSSEPPDLNMEFILNKLKHANRKK